MKIKIYSVTFLLFLSISSCKDIVVKKKEAKESKYKREITRYDLGDNSYKDIEFYINQKKEGKGFQTRIYNNHILDSTKGTFYTLKLSKTINNKTLKIESLQGTLKYYFDSIKDGKIAELTFFTSTKMNNKKEKVIFKDYDFKKNEIKFHVKNDNDTLMGLIYVQHLKDTIVKNEKKTRIREIIIPIDNHIETNNPFVDLKW